MTQEKIAIIAVTQDTAMFSEEDMKRINTELRTRFVEETDFKLKDENTIDEIIKEYKEAPNYVRTKNVKLNWKKAWSGAFVIC